MEIIEICKSHFILQLQNVFINTNYVFCSGLPQQLNCTALLEQEQSERHEMSSAYIFWLEKYFKQKIHNFNDL